LIPLLVVSPIHQIPLPLSQAMNPPQPCPTQREGVYASISVGEIVSIPSSIKKNLIHRRISLNSLPLASFLKYSYASEKYWWFSIVNAIMYPSKVVLTQKSIAHATRQSTWWSAAIFYTSQVHVLLNHSWNSGAS
jgi:hypothetical protein